MPTIRTILCPVDFSEPSTHALRYAIGLARSLGARVHAFHVYEMSKYAVAESPVVRDDLLPRGAKEAAEELAALVKSLASDGVPVTGTSKEGDPCPLIFEAAQEHAVDLIVMGSHGRGGVKRLVLGSVAERVVREAPVPVLVVRAEQAE